MFTKRKFLIDKCIEPCYLYISSRNETKKKGGGQMQKYNYSKLRGLIREKLKTEGAFAEALGRSQNYISNVFKGTSFFTQNDIAKAVEILGIAPEDIGLYFFAEEVHEAELS